MAPDHGSAAPLAQRTAGAPQTHSIAPRRTDIPARRDPNRRRPWKRATRRGRPVEIAIDRLIERSDAEILDELRRVARLVKAREMTVERFRPLARICFGTVHKRFGCWPAALIRAGLAHRRSRHHAADRRRAIATKAMSDAQILRALRAIARAKRSRMLLRQDVVDDDRLSLTMICRRFGGWPAVVAAAGLKRSRCGRTLSKQACFDNLVAVARHLRRLPRWSDMRRPPSVIGAPTYKRYFGSWTAALRALVANPGGKPAPRGRAAPAARAKPQRLEPQRKHRERARKIVTLTMRYQILARDRFRCQACGNSPATDPACKLHVDHVVPFARGGRTTAGNLRALCAACNIGKSDRAAR